MEYLLFLFTALLTIFAFSVLQDEFIFGEQYSKRFKKVERYFSKGE